MQAKLRRPNIIFFIEARCGCRITHAVPSILRVNCSELRLEKVPEQLPKTPCRFILNARMDYNGSEVI